MSFLPEQISQTKLQLREPGAPIRVAFMLQEHIFWNCFASVALEMNRRDSFWPLIVLPSCEKAAQSPANITLQRRKIEDLGLAVVDENKYNVHSAQPDIVFFIAPYPSPRKLAWLPKIMLLHDTLSALIPYCTEAMGDNEFLSNYFTCCKDFWRYFTSSEMCAQAYQTFLQHPAWFNPVVGNPEYDVVLNNPPDALPKFQAIIKMAAGRKILLWTPHYSRNWGNWQRLSGPMLRLFSTHADNLFVVLRPHQLISEGFYHISQGNLDKAIATGLAGLPETFNLMQQAGNFWLDVHGPGTESVLAADGLISDLSSMLTKGMALKKSLLFLKNPGHSDAGPATRIMNTHMHTGYDMRAVTKFVEILLDGNDPLLPVPAEVRNFFCGPTDGKSGLRIVDNLEDYFFRLVPEELPELP